MVVNCSKTPPQEQAKITEEEYMAYSLQKEISTLCYFI
jgi:hypothetical protein